MAWDKAYFKTSWLTSAVVKPSIVEAVREQSFIINW